MKPLLLTIMEEVKIAKKNKTFYCKTKKLFCKIAKCTQEGGECKTEKELLVSSQASELASYI